MNSLRKQGIIIFSILSLVIVACGGTAEEEVVEEVVVEEPAESLDSPAVTTATSVKTGTGVTEDPCPAEIGGVPTGADPNKGCIYLGMLNDFTGRCAPAGPGLEVAQRAMASEGFGEGARKAATLAVTALNTGIDIPNLNSDTQGEVRAALSGAAVGALGSNVSASSVISRSTGQILNNNLELLFQGVNLRSFPFSITFSPRSRQESTMVKDIIRRLKQSMAPKTGDLAAGANTGIFLKSPDVFQLRYLKDGHDHPFLNSFKLAALTGMTVNYTNAGTYASYGDGSPVSIRLNMTFKELNPIYSEDYDGMGESDGVGF